MGNQESVKETKLLDQDSENLWEVVRLEEEDAEKDEGYCVFTTSPGRGTQAEKCKNAIQVNRCPCYRLPSPTSCYELPSSL